MTGVVGDPGIVLDDLGDTLKRPHVGGIAVGQWALCQPALDLAKVGLVELGKTTGSSRRPQCGRASGLPLRVPPADTLAGHLELTGHVRLAPSLAEQSGRLFASALHGVEVPSGARSDRHHGHMDNTSVMGMPTVSHHPAPVSLYYASLFNPKVARLRLARPTRSAAVFSPEGIRSGHGGQLAGVAGFARTEGWAGGSARAHPESTEAPDPTTGLGRRVEAGPKGARL